MLIVNLECWKCFSRCINKACADSNDSRLSEPYPVKHGGGMEVHCDSAPCFSIIQLNGSLTAGGIIRDALNCPKNCNAGKDVRAVFGLHNSFSLRFASCTNPLPVGSDPECFGKYNVSDHRLLTIE